jgi:hypothetical protein
MCEETKISTCGCIIKQKALYFKIKRMGRCAHTIQFPPLLTPHANRKLLQWKKKKKKP